VTWLLTKFKFCRLLASYKNRGHAFLVEQESRNRMPSEIFCGHTFTKIKTLIKRGPTATIFFRDLDAAGLAVKITPTSASWYFSRRDSNLRIAPFESFGLNDLPALRELIISINKELGLGRDVKTLIHSFANGLSVADAGHLQDVHNGDGLTWEEVRDKYLAWAEINKNKATVRGYRSALGCLGGLRDDFKPIHGKPLASITTADLARVRNNIVERGRIGAAKGQGIRQANLTVSALKACFKYAVNNPDYGLISNPARDLSKALERAIPVTKGAEARALTQLELGELWHALLGCRNETARLILQLQLLTGQRRFTPTSAKKSDFQFDGVYDCVWSMEDKTHHWRKLPLPPVATSIVKQAMRLSRDDCDYLFPKQRPRREGCEMNTHINERTVSDQLEQFRKPGGIFEKMPFNVSTHDLRKTFITVLKPKMSMFEMSGHPMQPRDVEIITHANEGRQSVAEKIYDRNTYLDSKFSILKWWEDYVMEGYAQYCGDGQRNLTVLKNREVSRNTSYQVQYAFGGISTVISLPARETRIGR
jgi:integrase